jgi:plasmid stability protein
MTLTINLPDEQTAALAAKAQACGMSAEEYARRVLTDDLALVSPQPEAWEMIVENMKQVPAEDLAELPRDGASQIDHYVYGLPKRNL